MSVSTKVIKANTEEAVSIIDARNHLRMEDLTYDDDKIRALVVAATQYVEDIYALSLLEGIYEDQYQCFPEYDYETIKVRRSPLATTPELTVKYDDENGAEQILSTEDYVIGLRHGRPVVYLKINKTWPATSGLVGCVRIRYKAGFGTKPDAVPQKIRQAILLMVGDLYTNREDAPRSMPRASEMLLSSYFMVSI